MMIGRRHRSTVGSEETADEARGEPARGGRGDQGDHRGAVRDGGRSMLPPVPSPLLRELLTPAFAHLAEPGTSHASEPALTVSLWDSASTGAEPPPPRRARRTTMPGRVSSTTRAAARAAYQPGLETSASSTPSRPRRGTGWRTARRSRTGTRRLRSARSSSGGWARAATCRSTAVRWGRRPAACSSSGKGDRESRPWRSRASSRSSCTPATTTLR